MKMRAPLTVLALWLVLMASANLAAPLYAVYAQRFHFSSLVLTAIFATYAFVLVPALVVFGRLADHVGRRAVILAGLVAASVAVLVFAFAASTLWLFVARGLQGLAVGMVSGAATSALVELDPRGDRRRAALLAGLAQAAGSGVGPLAAGLLAQFAPDPIRLCYFVGFVALMCVAVGALTIPEGKRGPEPWRLQLPRVPQGIRRRFARVAVTAGLAWASAALFLSIVPPYAAKLLPTHNLALLAVFGAVALLSSCAIQVISRRRGGSSSRNQRAGLVALGTGLLGLAAAAPLHSLVLLLASGVSAGAGHGYAFIDAQQELNELAPGPRRGEVTAAFIAVIYTLVACSVVATGLLNIRFSLATSVATVALSVAAACLATATWHARTELNRQRVKGFTSETCELRFRSRTSIGR